jgi:uridine kinase
MPITSRRTLYKYCCGVLTQGGTRQVIIEGYRAFWDPVLLSMMTVRVWIDIPREEAWERRARTKPVPSGYFEALIWPWHEAYSLRVARDVAGRGVVRLDGTLPTATAEGVGRIIAELGVLERVNGPEGTP